MKTTTVKSFPVMGFKKRHLILVMAIIAIILSQSCEKSDEDQPVQPKENQKISCEAGCSSMSWEIKGETGPHTSNETCRNDWQGSKYIQTCEGRITFSNSGNSYTHKVIYNWIDCSISVDVNGLGTCKDKVGQNKSTECNCNIDQENAIIKYLEEQMI